MIRILLDYCSHSSFHGVSYLANRRRNSAEQIWWAISIVLSASLCSYAIYDSFLSWRENPVILSLSHESMSVGEIPFPAVTICPTIKMPISKFNYTDVYRAILKLDGNESRIVTDEEMKLMNVAAQICDDAIARDIWNNSHDEYSDSTIIQQITDLAPKIDDTMISCRFRNEMKNCNDLFAASVTDEGLCYSFNALNNNEIVSDELSSDFGEETFVPSSNWDMERGYMMLKNVDTDSYPYRVFGTSDPSGLTVVLSISKPNIDSLCGGPVQGFRIKFHNPSEDPQMWKQRNSLSPDATKLFHITPKITRSTDDIRKVYSKQNCETECLANYTLVRCGCVKFSMPRSNDTNICGLAKLRCIFDANSQMFQTRNYEKCQCLPSCSWLQYDSIEFQTPGNLAEYSKLMQKDLKVVDSLAFSRIIASFEEERTIPFIRSESHTLIDLLASSGGLFGLFMGASLLSFIELIYYFTIRITFDRFAINSSNTLN